uniref:Homeodomain-like protein n=1 Tax=Tanacetum cinerariifolium TaxID=118510 RepID=A0A6L2NAI2_TANCI|nr:homeodomain-like protein [Tanacetum cinerariifolium]
MENANPFVPAPPDVFHVRITQELIKLYAILAMIYSRLDNIKHTRITIPPIAPFKQLLNDFINLPVVIEVDNLESDDESIDTRVSPFLDLDDELGDGEVLNELNEYVNVGNFYRSRIINNVDGDGLAFPCMIGFRKFVAYFDPFLPMNIITRKAYNTIMVEGLENTGRSLVAIVRDVYVFVGSFTYVTEFIVLEDIGEFIVSDMAEVVTGRPLELSLN